ncbi:hypothetical protein [Pseudoduganella lutea]|uniref:Uncharacterized protein n=1 Tax=Pseudoduganella lutea TaxID=321985 RepID=A0A4P6KV95_9BURK|nr:hypothetical protein [Pseudoduganella lutea]QBE62058.1 hypothetical protein EWM63_02885 [Pseudoduganella lutea]
MNAGTKIVRSFELVESIWSQVQELTNSLSAMTEAALEKGEFGQLRSAGPWREAWDETASGWGSTKYAMSFPAAGKRRRNDTIDAWINYQISLFGSGIPPLVGATQESLGPVVHVSFWHYETDFLESGFYVEFPSAWDDSTEIKESRLLFWDSEKEGQLPQWTFSIRLLDLNSEDALRKSIIEPVRALLSGSQPALALPEDLPGLVFYEGHDRGDAGWTLLAKDRPGNPTQEPAIAAGAGSGAE